MTSFWRFVLRPILIVVAVVYSVAVVCYAAGLAVAQFIGGYE